jgi:DNA-binding NtrC family response regulator
VKRAARWRALVVEDEAASRDAVEVLMRAAGFEVLSFASCGAVHAFVGAHDVSDVDVALVDLGLPDGDGLDLIGPLLNLPHGCLVVVLSGQRKLERAIEAMRRGAVDYLAKPLDAAGLRLALSRIERQLDERDERRRLRRALMKHGSYQGLVGRSPAMLAVYEQIERAAPSDLPIFVRGESGTGKELVARAVHEVSRRRRGPFVAVNCGAIPAQLAESELFGHERGAFTGAVKPQAGAFERADGGTLFLDEITEMPIELQVVLLRALESGRIQRVGAGAEQRVDVRVVAASNRDPAAAVREGRLRHDLLYRLDVIPIALPPLSERGDDVLLLAHHLLPEPALAFDPSATRARVAHRWPGTGRVLKNAVLRAAVLSRGPAISAADLGLDEATPEAASAEHASPDAIVVPADATLADAERLVVMATLVRLGHHRGAAAEALGIAPKTLYNKLKAWGEGGA